MDNNEIISKVNSEVDDIQDAVDKIERLLSKWTDEDTENLTTISRTSIEWNADKTDVPFDEMQLMATLDKVLFSGIHPKQIITHLEQLLP